VLVNALLRSRQPSPANHPALVIGFRSSAGPLAWLAVAGILLLFTLALTWVAVIPGLTASSPDRASAFSYPIIFLPFVSSAFGVIEVDRG
jgi:ABC-2 type transport system permease protein